MIPKLNFSDRAVSLTCTCCQETKNINARSDADEERLKHIFDLVLASTRTQGYNDGYLCLKCEKKNSVSTRGVRSFCRKYLTLDHFESRRLVRSKVNT